MLTCSKSCSTAVRGSTRRSRFAQNGRTRESSDSWDNSFPLQPTNGNETKQPCQLADIIKSCNWLVQKHSVQRHPNIKQTARQQVNCSQTWSPCVLWRLQNKTVIVAYLEYPDLTCVDTEWMTHTNWSRPSHPYSGMLQSSHQSFIACTSHCLVQQLITDLNVSNKPDTAASSTNCSVSWCLLTLSASWSNLTIISGVSSLWNIDSRRRSNYNRGSTFSRNNRCTGHEGKEKSFLRRSNSRAAANVWKQTEPCLKNISPRPLDIWLQLEILGLMDNLEINCHTHTQVVIMWRRLHCLPKCSNYCTLSSLEVPDP